MIANWQTAGLIKTSVLKPVFTTIEQGLVMRTIGALTTTDHQALRKLVANTIG